MMKFLCLQLKSTNVERDREEKEEGARGKKKKKKRERGWGMREYYEEVHRYKPIRYICKTFVLFFFWVLFQEVDFGDKEVFHVLITGSLKSSLTQESI